VTFLSCGCSRDATGRKRTNLYGVFDRVSQDLTAFVLSGVVDVPIDSETFVVTSSILRICRFEDAPRGRVCVCVFRGMSVRALSRVSPEKKVVRRLFFRGRGRTAGSVWMRCGPYPPIPPAQRRHTRRYHVASRCHDKSIFFFTILRPWHYSLYKPALCGGDLAYVHARPARSPADQPTAMDPYKVRPNSLSCLPPSRGALHGGRRCWCG
jgi:hypothetical protein